MSEEKHKLQGHLEFQGLRVAVENRKGSVRSGVGADGKPWRTVMKAPYGYLKGTRGADGEEVDVYVGPHKDSPNAYVVHQHKETGKGYDEDKVILGTPDEVAAKKLYLKHYNSPKFLGPISEVPVERLKALIEEGKTLKKISMASCLEELAKLGAVSDEQAERALGRYEALERNKPTVGQVGGYGALGAVAGPAIGAIGDIIAGQPVFGGPGRRLRGVASRAVTGALSAGALPLLRQHMDRHAELGTLKGYLAEHGVDHEREGMNGGKLSSPFVPVEKEAEEKAAFQTSMYSAQMGAPGFKQNSQMPPFRAPSLRSAVGLEPQQIATKLGSLGITPAGRRVSSMRVGLPKVTAPSGPSIAQVAKPVGFGKPMPGANKGTI